MAEPSPLPEDLATIERLNAQLSALELELGSEREQLTREKTQRDELERQVLREEPRASLAQRGAVPALVLGVPVGLALMTSWFGLEWSQRHLLFSAGVPFAVSAWWLLRGAWRAGRASGARGPG